MDVETDMLWMIMGRSALLVAEENSWTPVEVFRHQTGQPTTPKLTLSASGQSTCLLTAPFSSLLTAQHMESTAGLLVRMTISSSMMVWREIVHLWENSVNLMFHLPLPPLLELLELSLRVDRTQVVQPVAKEFVLSTVLLINTTSSTLPLPTETTFVVSY